jgi:hypothetical protein
VCETDHGEVKTALKPAVRAQTILETPVLTIKADEVKATVSPTLYGFMTEEINYSYEGGLYGELIQNRIFRDSLKGPVHWSVVQESGELAAIALDQSQPIAGTVLATSLRLDAGHSTSMHRVGIANDGYWGIPVKPNTIVRGLGPPFSSRWTPC